MADIEVRPLPTLSGAHPQQAFQYEYHNHSNHNHHHHHQSSAKKASQQIVQASHGHHHHAHGIPSWKSLAAGGVGGTLEVLTDHPIDLVKVRMQTKSSSSIGAGALNATTNLVKKKPSTVRSILSSVLAQDGFSGLYRGASIRVATLMPATAISFWGLDVGKQLVRSYEKMMNPVAIVSEELTVPQVCVAGAFSGLPVTLFATPSERIKCLLQIQKGAAATIPGKEHYNGPLDCGKKLYRAGGLPNLYKGLAITTCRNVPGYAVWFGTYEILKRQILSWQGLPTTAEPSLTAIIVAGGLAGSISWAVMIPFDVVKSRIQTRHESISMVQAYRDLTAKSGPRALLRGLGPAVMIAFPANAACFLGMELAWKALKYVD